MSSHRHRHHRFHHTSKSLKARPRSSIEAASSADVDDGLEKDFMEALAEIAASGGDPGAVWAHLELLTRYVANLLAEPAAWAYRKISTTNPYYQRVAKVPGAVWFLLAAGFAPSEDGRFLTCDAPRLATLKLASRLLADAIARLRATFPDATLTVPAPDSASDASKASREVCAICLDDVREPSCGDCSHVFCRQCLDQWAKQKATCPVCRKSLFPAPAPAAPAPLARPQSQPAAQEGGVPPCAEDVLRGTITTRASCRLCLESFDFVYEARTRSYNPTACPGCHRGIRPPPRLTAAVQHSRLAQPDAQACILL